MATPTMATMRQEVAKKYSARFANTKRDDEIIRIYYSIMKGVKKK